MDCISIWPNFNMNDSIYYSYRKLHSFGTGTIIVIGARGIGKTYGAKKYAIKRFLQDGKRFAWIRDTESAADKIRKDKGKDFFKDVKQEFKQCDGFIKQDVFYINDKSAGVLLALSTYYNNKGDVLNDIDTVILDEFIPESVQRTNGSRARQFLNTIQTIGRLRDNYKVILLANSLDLADEILDIFDFKIDGFGYYINRKKDAALHYAPNNPAFDAADKLSIAGKLTAGTMFEASIRGNKFENDNIKYFEKRPLGCNLLLILHNEYGCTRLYDNGSTIFCDKDLNPDTNKNLRFVKTIQEVTPLRHLMPKETIQILRNAFNSDAVEFKNATIRKIFIEFIK